MACSRLRDLNRSCSTTFRRKRKLPNWLRRWQSSLGAYGVDCESLVFYPSAACGFQNTEPSGLD